MKTAQRFTLSSILLIALLLFLSFGALFGGWSLITQPDGSGLGMPSSWLAGSPFADYRIPGIILFTLFGLAPLVVVYGLIRRPSWRWADALLQPLHMHWSLAAALLIGVAQMIWIVVQLLLMSERFFLQPLLFVVGLAIALLAWRVARAPQSSRIAGDVRAPSH